MGFEVQERVALGPMTTFQVGGEARFFAEVRTEDELREALSWAAEQRVRVYAMGGGSNLLVRDEGFPGLVVRLRLRQGIAAREAGRRVEYTVGAGVPWEELVDRVCGDGMSGMECLAGIPGLCGASPVQNIGAYGQEVSQTVVRVRAWDRERGCFVEMRAAECGFGYRRSVFNGVGVGRYVITSVVFAVEQGARPELTYAELRRRFGEGVRPEPVEVAAAVREIRRGKGMVVVEGEADSRSAGSFFKNPLVPTDALERVSRAAGVAEAPHWPVPAVEDGPAMAAEVKLSAAWLVERAGFGKGFAMEAAGISSRHSLALINRTGEATYADIARLRDAVRAGVREQFGVELEQEPMELGPETVDRYARR